MVTSNQHGTKRVPFPGKRHIPFVFSYPLCDSRGSLDGIRLYTVINAKENRLSWGSAGEPG